MTRDTAPLLPCPFCGGTAQIIEVEEPSNRGGYVVQCDKCEASTRVWFPIKDDVKNILTDAWNKRAQGEAARDPGLRVGLEAMRDALKAARAKLWATYAATPRLEPLFDQMNAALAVGDALLAPSVARQLNILVNADSK